MINACRITCIIVFIILLVFNGLFTRFVGGLFDILLVVGIVMNGYRLIVDISRKI